MIVHIAITPDEHHALKQIALDRREPLTRVLAEVLREFLRANGKEQ